MAKLQTLSAKIGEIKFRKKILMQHLGKNKVFIEEPDHQEILEILKKRVLTTRKIFKTLQKKGFSLSPFLEIGAEKGQRSMVLVNEFQVEGIALDLSLESLLNAKKFASLLGFKGLPTLICADTYHLPFPDNTFSFVFCFETLHHFPDPEPVIKEIYRVLAPTGIFYFGEEPVKQIFNFNLWRRGYHLRPWEKFLKYLGILPFLSRIGKTEVEYGVLEEEFTLSTWQKALSVFEKIKAVIQPVFFGPQSVLIKDRGGWKSPKLITLSLIALQGGGIEGYGIKEGKLKTQKRKGEIFICPDCQKPVVKKREELFCLNCKRRFSQKNGVLMFLPINLEKKLYG